MSNYLPHSNICVYVCVLCVCMYISTFMLYIYLKAVLHSPIALLTKVLYHDTLIYF